MDHKQIILVVIIVLFSGLVLSNIINREEAMPAGQNNYQPVTTEPVNEEVTEGEVAIEDISLDDLDEFPIDAWKKYEKGNEPVLLYVKQVSKELSNEYNRSFPTVQIIRRVGNNESELLAQVGKVGEYPYSYVLSPDKKYLLINLESKLQILDLETKELEDLLIAKETIASVSYSPDGTKLFIFDQKYGKIDADYYIHVFDLASRQDEIIKTGKSPHSFFAHVWRDDDLVTMTEARGMFSPIYYFSFASNEIKEPNFHHSVGVVSLDGYIMSILKETTFDPCNEMGNTAPSMYFVMDPVSGYTYGIIGREDYRNVVMAFSPDHKEVLYYSTKPWEDSANCAYDEEKEYYVQEIGTDNITQIDNPTELKQSWGYNYIGASTDYDYNRELKTETWQILIDGQPLIQADEALEIVAEFLQ